VRLNPTATIYLRVRCDDGSVLEPYGRFSDEEDLLGMFLGLPCAKMFMFGEESHGLSYLRQLEKGGVVLAQIADSGHFPMYSNPVEMYCRIAGFLKCSS
jgi:pimeloyl-ACP methyl ester carboxylesterase